MPINLLRRFNFNAPSTPYSSCRSNIEHVTYFEERDYSNIIEPCQILKVNGFSGTCNINISKISSKLFNQGRHRFFELTHHDPSANDQAVKIQKRVDRIKNLQVSKKPCILFYNHRSSNGFKNTLPVLENGLNNLTNKFNKSIAICITQHIIDEKTRKKVEAKYLERKGIIFATFHTHRKWEGNNLDVFFGRIDDDLFEIFFNYVDKIIEKTWGELIS